MSLSLTATTTDNVILVIVVICPSILEKPTMHDVLTKMVWLDVRYLYV